MSNIINLVDYLVEIVLREVLGYLTLVVLAIFSRVAADETRAFWPDYMDCSGICIIEISRFKAAKPS